MDTNAISYTLTPETAGSCEFAEPVPGCSPIFEKEAARVLEDLETRLKASTATWKVGQLNGADKSKSYHGNMKGKTADRGRLDAPGLYSR